MEERAKELSERFLNYSVEIIRIVSKLPKTSIGKHLGNQVLRSGTSGGANYEEASGAQSRADFIHKLQIVLKELKETLYWIKLIDRCNMLDGNKLHIILTETEELINIIAKSLITAKGNK